MPPHTNHHAAKIYRATAKAYDALADIFKGGDAQRLYDEAQTGHEIWQHVRFSRISSIELVEY